MSDQQRNEPEAPACSRNERIKTASNFLRGTIKEGLDAPLTGSIAEDDTQLTKFHGLYLQDDRDLRPERRKKRMEPAYAFMARVRLPAGSARPDQWLGWTGSPPSWQTARCASPRGRPGSSTGSSSRTSGAPSRRSTGPASTRSRPAAT
jgi:hypothetical protein